MFKHIFVLIFSLLFSSISFADKSAYCKKVIAQNYPTVQSQQSIYSVDQLICHKGYVSAYSYNLKEPVFVGYFLSANRVNKRIKREDNFQRDPKVQYQYSASDIDYSHSGYDRGHFAPYASMDFSKESAAESFYYSNIGPQKAGLNRQGWARLEKNVRRWTSFYKGLYVYTGVIFKKGVVHKTIGKHHVAVPDYYYKVIYAPNKHSKPRVMAFALPNASVSKKDLHKYVVPVSKIEQYTRLNFFPNKDIDKNNGKLKNWRLI